MADSLRAGPVAGHAGGCGFASSAAKHPSAAQSPGPALDPQSRVLPESPALSLHAFKIRDGHNADNDSLGLIMAAPEGPWMQISSNFLH